MRLWPVLSSCALTVTVVSPRPPRGGETSKPLPVVVSEPFLKELFDSVFANPKTEVEVNLPEQTITNKATGKSEHFEINAYKKHCLMNGLDDIDFLVENKDKIEAWENKNEA